MARPTQMLAGDIAAAAARIMTGQPRPKSRQASPANEQTDADFSPAELGQTGADSSPAKVQTGADPSPAKAQTGAGIRMRSSPREAVRNSTTATIQGQLQRTSEWKSLHILTGPQGARRGQLILESGNDMKLNLEGAPTVKPRTGSRKKYLSTMLLTKQLPSRPQMPPNESTKGVLKHGASCQPKNSRTGVPAWAPADMKRVFDMLLKAAAATPTGERPLQKHTRIPNLKVGNSIKVEWPNGSKYLYPAKIVLLKPDADKMFCVNSSAVKVHYQGFKARWDEWIDTTSERLHSSCSSARPVYLPEDADSTSSSAWGAPEVKRFRGFT